MQNWSGEMAKNTFIIVSQSITPYEVPNRGGYDSGDKKRREAQKNASSSWFATSKRAQLEHDCMPRRRRRREKVVCLTSTSGERTRHADTVFFWSRSKTNRGRRKRGGIFSASVALRKKWFFFL